MDVALAVITIRNRAALNAVFLSSHVLDDGSMDDDAVTFTDVLNVLRNTVDVVPDGAEARDMAALQDLGRCEQPRSVADGPNGPPRSVQVPHQLLEALVAAPVVWACVVSA